MQLTLLQLHGLGTNRKTIQVHQRTAIAHKYMEMRKAHNSVKLDVRSSEWDDTCCVTYAWDILIVTNSFLKLNVIISQKGLCYWIPLAKIALEGPVSQRYRWRLLSTNMSKFCRLAMPPVKKVDLSLLRSISVHVQCIAKKWVFIAAILSKLHASWQLVMQGYAIGLTTPGCGSWLLGVTFIQQIRCILQAEQHSLFGFMLLHLHGECICSLVSCKLVLELGMSWNTRW